MPKLSFIIRSLSAAAAFATFAGCHHADPAPTSKRSPVVTTPAAPTPVAPPLVATPRVDGGVPATTTAPVAEVSAEVEPGANQLIKDARDALTAGELDRALRLARLAVLEAPGRSSAWNTLGRVQLRRGEREAALQSFEQAVETNPASAWAQNNYGLALLYVDRADEAVAAFEEATDLSPETALMWNNLGMAYEHVDRIEEARVAYKHAMGMSHRGATENFVRLEGVRSLRRTAKVDVDHPEIDEDQVGITEGL